MAAFEHLGGVPEEILYDRMKTVVLGEAQEEPQHIVYNAKLVALAKHYGFSLPCSTEKRPALVDTSSFR